MAGLLLPTPSTYCLEPGSLLQFPFVHCLEHPRNDGLSHVSVMFHPCHHVSMSIFARRPTDPVSSALFRAVPGRKRRLLVCWLNGRSGAPRDWPEASRRVAYGVKNHSHWHSPTPSEIGWQNKHIPHTSMIIHGCCIVHSITILANSGAGICHLRSN